MNEKRRAFTLLELIVSIGVIALLVSLLAAPIGRVRESARDTVRQSQLRAHARAMTLYCTDSRDVFPYFFQPEATYNIVKIGSRTGRARFFDSYWAWNLLIGPASYEGGSLDNTFRPPGRRPPLISEWYFYSATLVSRPEFWRPETRIGPSQWLAVKFSEVRFPSAKALVTNHGDVFDPGGARVLMLAMADGSTYVARPDMLGRDFIPPHPTGEGMFDQSAIGAPGLVGMHTVEGVYGRDVNAR